MKRTIHSYNDWDQLRKNMCKRIDSLQKEYENAVHIHNNLMLSIKELPEDLNKPRPLKLSVKEAILKALLYHNCNRQKTAQALKIGERTLYRHLTKYGLVKTRKKKRRARKK